MPWGVITFVTTDGGIVIANVSVCVNLSYMCIAHLVLGYANVCVTNISKIKQKIFLRKGTNIDMITRLLYLT